MARSFRDTVQKDDSSYGSLMKNRLMRSGVRAVNGPMT
jgi:hypothetical protein